jgi:hypothetical protein
MVWLFAIAHVSSALSDGEISHRIGEKEGKAKTARSCSRYREVNPDTSKLTSASLRPTYWFCFSPPKTTGSAVAS